jgi:hypothetical protein
MIGIALLLMSMTSTVVDPATYVGNVYGTVSDDASRPIGGESITLFDDAGSAVRRGSSNADGTFLINDVPTPFDGRDYVVSAGDFKQKVRVLPGASMALQLDIRLGAASSAAARYHHEINASAKVGAEVFTGSIFATREGLVGGTTANGHVIVVNDRFAALPSRRALSTNFGHEREVRVTYRGRTTTVPVWDIGPWNIHDDYWNPASIRETFKDLPWGLPEAEAAFTNKYNGGLDERGRVVKTPAGIDLADGTFWIDLVMGANDRVTVEYLWVETEFSGPRRRAVRH